LGECRYTLDNNGNLIPKKKLQKVAPVVQQQQQQYIPLPFMNPMVQQHSSMTQPPPAGFCMSFDKNNKRIEIVGAITMLLPGGGKKIVVNTTIHHNSKLISARIWIDTGAQITLISKSFVENHKMILKKTPKIFVLTGVNSSLENKFFYYRICPFYKLQKSENTSSCVRLCSAPRI
jgi:hypothetical protein